MRLEHRTEKWNPVFGIFRCSLKILDRPLCVRMDARRSRWRHHGPGRSRSLRRRRPVARGKRHSRGLASRQRIHAPGTPAELRRPPRLMTEDQRVTSRATLGAARGLSCVVFPDCVRLCRAKPIRMAKHAATATRRTALETSQVLVRRFRHDPPSPGPKFKIARRHVVFVDRPRLFHVKVSQACTATHRRGSALNLFCN